MKKVIAGFLLCAGMLLAIAGCAEPGEKGITPAEANLGSCETYTDTLEALLPFRQQGKISESNLKLIDLTRETVDPLCLGSPPDVNSSVKNIAIDNGGKLLLSILATLST